MGVMLPVTVTPLQVARLLRYGLVAASGVLALGGCVTEAPPRPPSAVERLESQALYAVDAGDATGAASLYEQLVNQTTGSAQIRYMIAAARQWLAAGESPSASGWLDRAAAGASREQSLDILLLRAELALLDEQPAAALQHLAMLPEPPPARLRAPLLELEGRGLFAVGRLAEGIATLAAREGLLTDRGDIGANQRLIWDALRAAPASELPPPPADPVVAGWLALHPAAAANGNPFMQRTALENWRARYPAHPASQILVEELVLEIALVTRYPSQIALLLPLTGRQQPAARAVRDGFVAAYMAVDSHIRPRVRVYDTSQVGASQAYLQAEREGADFIVGPLLKRDVEEVIAAAGRTGTLTLNFAAPEVEAPTGLFQFALAPEDEAAQAAGRAVTDGRARAVALIANNEWGIRILTSFRNELQTLGGTLVDFKGYDPSAQDFSGAITSLLHLDQSAQRQRRLAANLGQPLEFQPRRRQDVDLIFLAAAAESARLLRPQLRFHYAQDLPTYATSEVYQPGDGRSNADLNGIEFPEMPWIVEPDSRAAHLRDLIEDTWPQRGPRLIRLYAMGFDAYRLVPLLFNQGDMVALRLPGLTGLLTMDARGRIHRRLAWARFQAGRLVPAQPLMQENVGAGFPSGR